MFADVETSFGTFRFFGGGMAWFPVLPRFFIPRGKDWSFKPEPVDRLIFFNRFTLVRWN